MIIFLRILFLFTIGDIFACSIENAAEQKCKYSLDFLSTESAQKTAMITGIAGQDGAYLAKHLIDLGYKVIGTHRRTSTDECFYFWRLKKLGILKNKNLILSPCDIIDPISCQNILRMFPEIQEVYNLAAQSFVQESFNGAMSTLQITGAGPLNLLEAIKQTNKNIRFYQASTSELYGKVQMVPQSEKTPFYPRSPYGVAKQYAHWMTINYRESYGLFACCGILFNHESPLRGEEFVSRKVAKGVAQIKKGELDYLEVGNIDSQRDWGFAGDYVKAMHLILQQPVAEEYVIATGKTYTVRYLIEKAFARVGITLRWQGEETDEVGINEANNQVVVKVNPKYFRPAEVDLLIGDPTKSIEKLGWRTEVSADDLINMMVDAELIE